MPPTDEERDTVPSLDEFVGQADLIRLLRDEVAAAKVKHRTLPNILFTGEPGLGKTLLVNVIAQAWEASKLVWFMGPTLAEDAMVRALIHLPVPGYDAAGYLKEPSKAPRYLVAIDECEEVKTKLWETLHKVAEPQSDSRRIVECKVPGEAKTRTCWLPHMSFILITNFAGTLRKRAGAMLNRCHITWQFEPYTPQELAQILVNEARQENLPIDKQAIELIANRSAGIPRTAKNLFHRAANHLYAANASHDSGLKRITATVAADAMAKLKLDDLGLGRLSRAYLQALVSVPNGKLSLQGLASRLGTDTITVVQDVEPFLMRQSLVAIVPGGRQITDKGLTHIGMGEANPFISRMLDTN